MLVLQRFPDEDIYLFVSGPAVTDPDTVIRIKNMDRKTRIGIDAGPEIKILRGELCYPHVIPYGYTQIYDRLSREGDVDARCEPVGTGLDPRENVFFAKKLV